MSDSDICGSDRSDEIAGGRARRFAPPIALDRHGPFRVVLIVACESGRFGALGKNCVAHWAVPDGEDEGVAVGAVLTRMQLSFPRDDPRGHGHRDMRARVARCCQSNAIFGFVEYHIVAFCKLQEPFTVDKPNPPELLDLLRDRLVEFAPDTDCEDRIVVSFAVVAQRWHDHGFRRPEIAEVHPRVASAAVTG